MSPQEEHRMSRIFITSSRIILLALMLGAASLFMQHATAVHALGGLVSNCPPGSTDPMCMGSSGSQPSGGCCGSNMPSGNNSNNTGF
jgi:hypothetical protein